MRGGSVKKAAGFQSDLVCLTPWVNGEAPAAIDCLTLNPAFGLLAYGNGSGLVIVDFLQVAPSVLCPLSSVLCPLYDVRMSASG